MEPNVEKITELLKEKFNDNKAAMAEAVGVDRAQIFNIVCKGKGAGAQFFGGLMRYCKDNGLNFEDYIFLPPRVNNIHAENKSKRGSRVG
jgi:hypothetical protein